MALGAFLGPRRELNDLKNNKVSFAVMDRFNQTRGWLQSAALLQGRKVSEQVLAVPFRVLFEEPPARWPAAEAAAAVRGKAAQAADPLREAAVAQRLTSELRQTLFVALMGAEDFEDAVEPLGVGWAWVGPEAPVPGGGRGEERPRGGLRGHLSLCDPREEAAARPQEALGSCR